MQVLRKLKIPNNTSLFPEHIDENILVGMESADDAAVYRLNDDTAIVSTLDFFPPIVDDPFIFGQITAVNALSDIYAMGGTPSFAENIVCFPKKLGLDVLSEILCGSKSKLNEAQTSLVGGHSIEDKEIKYGLSVTGFIDPKKIITTKGALPGSKLLLTKPLGVGILMSAVKAGYIKAEDLTETFESMKLLNKNASLVMQEVGVNACTDVTGFGFLGHLLEMIKASGVSAVINSKEVPVFDSALKFVKKRKARPLSIETNLEFVADETEFSSQLGEELKSLLLDPQTSGGLLISLDKAKVGDFIARLKEFGEEAFVVGEVFEKSPEYSIKVE